jgi:hypothetical protein
MKSLAPAIAASFLTIFALAPSSLAASEFAATAGILATQIRSVEPYPSIKCGAPTPQMLAQMQSPDGAENQNDQGEATNPDDQGNNDQGNGDDAQQDNGENAQNGDADGNGDADQNSNGEDNGDNGGQDNGEQQEPGVANPSVFSTTVR